MFHLHQSSFPKIHWLRKQINIVAIIFSDSFYQNRHREISDHARLRLLISTSWLIVQDHFTQMMAVDRVILGSSMPNRHQEGICGWFFLITVKSQCIWIFKTGFSCKRVKLIGI